MEIVLKIGKKKASLVLDLQLVISLTLNGSWRRMEKPKEIFFSLTENHFTIALEDSNAADIRLITITTLIVIYALLCVRNILQPAQC